MSKNYLHFFWRSSIPVRIGVIGLALLVLGAIYAPFIANGRPLLAQGSAGWEFPFWRSFFAPDSPEVLVEKFFNFLSLMLPLGVLLRRRRKLLVILAILWLLPFIFVSPKVDKIDYRRIEYRHAVFSPIPYGPFKLVAKPYSAPDGSHWCGADEIGRDVAARLLYGARVSLAVGLFGALIALLIGTPVGLLCGMFGGKFDLLVMRLVEILLCFPTFLLLLILMSLLGDRDFEQSALLLVAVIGATGWIGTTFLVRGEVLKQKQLPYIEACRVAGVPMPRILFRELLPNVSGVLLITFTFSVAGAILAESSLSFLGFGVRAPTASWGGLLRQAFDNPLDYWHLTLFPGAALFIATISFNFLGEGLRRKLDVRTR